MDVTRSVLAVHNECEVPGLPHLVEHLVAHGSNGRSDRFALPKLVRSKKLACLEGFTLPGLLVFVVEANSSLLVEEVVAEIQDCVTSPRWDLSSIELDQGSIGSGSLREELRLTDSPLRRAITQSRTQISSLSRYAKAGGDTTSLNPMPQDPDNLWKRSITGMSVLSGTQSNSHGVDSGRFDRLSIPTCPNAIVPLSPDVVLNAYEIKTTLEDQGPATRIRAMAKAIQPVPGVHAVFADTAGSTKVLYAASSVSSPPNFNTVDFHAEGNLDQSWPIGPIPEAFVADVTAAAALHGARPQISTDLPRISRHPILSFERASISDISEHRTNGVYCCEFSVANITPTGLWETLRSSGLYAIETHAIQQGASSRAKVTSPFSVKQKLNVVNQARNQ